MVKRPTPGLQIKYLTMSFCMDYILQIYKCLAGIFCLYGTSQKKIFIPFCSLTLSWFYFRRLLPGRSRKQDTVIFSFDTRLVFFFFFFFLVVWVNCRQYFSTCIYRSVVRREETEKTIKREKQKHPNSPYPHLLQTRWALSL